MSTKVLLLLIHGENFWANSWISVNNCQECHRKLCFSIIFSDGFPKNHTRTFRGIKYCYSSLGMNWFRKWFHWVMIVVILEGRIIWWNKEFYTFFIREQCHWIYNGQCDKPPRKLLRCWWANDSNFHHKSGQITKGSPPWLSSTSPRTSKNSSATLQYPGRSPYRAFYSFCSCRFIGKVSSVPAHNVWINVKLLHLQIILTFTFTSNLNLHLNSFVNLNIINSRLQRRQFLINMFWKIRTRERSNLTFWIWFAEI